MRFRLLCGISAVWALGCEAGDNQERRDPTPPDPTCAATVVPWSAPAFAENAKQALGLRASLDALVARMRNAELAVEAADATSLETQLATGEPAIKSVVAPAWDHFIDDIFGEFAALTAAGPVDLVSDDALQWVPGEHGGIFGTDSRGINPGGLELRQLIDKGLYAGGGLYRYALALTEGAITPETIDALAAAWGSNETLSPEGRTDSANYSFGMGYHSTIATALTEARSYAADPNCAAERDAALVRFFRTWEEAMVARTLFYAHFAEQTLIGATTDDERADALHEYSEGLALTFGFLHPSTVSAGPLQNAPNVLTDAIIRDALTPLGLNPHNFAASTIGNFVENPITLLPAIGVAETVLKQAFGWSDADLARFRAPTPG